LPARAPIDHGRTVSGPQQAFHVRAECSPLQSVLKQFYERLRARGKLERVLVAVMRRIIVILNAMLKTNTTWTKPCAAALEKN
jgi:hypothetical protein